MLSIKKVSDRTWAAFYNLSQQYEAEFARITKKRPNSNGVYKYTSPKAGKYEAWIAFDRKQLIGFVVVDVRSERFDIAEFYIIPASRNERFGEQLATFIFDNYPGSWQVRQIMGAEYARDFWIAIIKKYTGGKYKASKVSDSEWGSVYLQRFEST